MKDLVTPAFFNKVSVCSKSLSVVLINPDIFMPLLAACVLTDQPCVLSNVPRIGDVEVMARLLMDLGAQVEGIGTSTI